MIDTRADCILATGDQGDNVSLKSFLSIRDRNYTACVLCRVTEQTELRNNIAYTRQTSYMHTSMYVSIREILCMAVVLTVLYGTGHCSVVAVCPSFLHSVDMPTWRASTYLTPFTTYVEVL